jgi:hAT family C-terminal dimerisation region
MALDILSIPVMLADPERLFLGAKITISNRRNRLGIYTIEALECLKSWLKILTFLEDKDKDRSLVDTIEEDSRQVGVIGILE